MKPYFNRHLELNHIGITRYQNGIMLFDIQQGKTSPLLSLSEFFSLPYSTYLLDLQGCTVKINDIGAAVCGFESSEQARGLSIFHVSSADSAKNLLDNCDSVTQQESVKIFDELNMRHDGQALQFLSIKFPCYDDKQQLQGVLGLSIVVGQHPLAEAITKLTELGLLKNNQSDPNQILNLNLGNITLTSREAECLQYTVKGYTAKEIAQKLSISPRTVEDYINQTKSKLGVLSKQQMIQKVLGH